MTFDPKKYADEAIGTIVRGTSDCDVKKTMDAIAIMSANAEVAFHEGQIDEDEMLEYKDIVEEHIAKFTKNCSCSKK